MATKVPKPVTYIRMPIVRFPPPLPGSIYGNTTRIVWNRMEGMDYVRHG